MKNIILLIFGILLVFGALITANYWYPYQLPVSAIGGALIAISISSILKKK